MAANSKVSDLDDDFLYNATAEVLLDWYRHTLSRSEPDPSPSATVGALIPLLRQARPTEDPEAIRHAARTLTRAVTELPPEAESSFYDLIQAITELEEIADSYRSG